MFGNMDLGGDLSLSETRMEEYVSYSVFSNDQLLTLLSAFPP